MNSIVSLLVCCGCAGLLIVWLRFSATSWFNPSAPHIHWAKKKATYIEPGKKPHILSQEIQVSHTHWAKKYKFTTHMNWLILLFILEYSSLPQVLFSTKFDVLQLLGIEWWSKGFTESYCIPFQVQHKLRCWTENYRFHTGGASSWAKPFYPNLGFLPTWQEMWCSNQLLPSLSIYLLPHSTFSVQFLRCLGQWKESSL